LWGCNVDNCEEHSAELLVKTKVAPSTLLVDKELPERRGYGVVEAIDPHDGGRWEMRVSERRMKSVAERSRGQVLELAYVLPEVLRCPTAIFQGIREEGEEDWLCYCGLPSHGYRRNGDRISAPEEEVYLVFVSADRVAYNSRWERCDQGNSKFPEDYQNRFDKWVL